MSLKERYGDVKWKYRVASAYFNAWLHLLRLRHTSFIGITGSAGKTTTKDLCYLILSGFYPVAQSYKSLNVVKATADFVLEVESKHRFSIIEMSGNRPGALDLPLWLVKPEIAVLTNIEKDHFRAFKGESVDGIAREKAKLIEALSENGTAVLNMDDPRVKVIGERCKAKVIWVGKSKGATLRLLNATSSYPQPLTLTIKYEGITHEVITGLHGTYLATSVLCALGVALAAGIRLDQAIPRLALAVPVEGRMQPVVMGDGVTFIRDDMKAPAWSLPMVLDFLSEATAVRKIAVVGSISDFSGDRSDKYKQFARQVLQHADMVIFVGDNAHRALRARKDENDSALQGFLTLKEASSFLQKTLRPGDLVLLKGSNKSDHLQRLILDRYKPIQCWQERCGLEHFCDCCVYLYRADSVADLGSDIRTESKIQSIAVVSKEEGVAIPIIVGLGNPGAEYKNTPHNIGYFVLDSLAENHGAIWQETDEGQICSIQLESKPVSLFKATAYMNETGPKLQRYLAKTGCLPEQCIIVHDDTDIEFGKIYIKSDGGDAGHWGVRSCLVALGTDQVKRLRLGVGVPGKTGSAKRRVLTNFSQEEQQRLQQIVEDAVVILGKTLSAFNSI
ncbi:aminoacyl-tRNA hydrolase [Nitrosomonas eutropha]|uniref:Aminoacyl-tRNA hydrolase n=2 Tax=Nitrosomonas eutropha TaxID=916 RepID=A0ABX5MBQ7_9PROT|nr:aminoacyl-tRNA hydrolase [Nitrosomonas eutropha]ABI59168.1 peptidyl-tRNA hydrolase [Nitrosomonas eutropha C91]PXV83468.1 aminoacyl-tRNA hydrolase [Nitrosomonas eutropha]SEI63787.1 aminoacyl-tRNA hydrolase [Nitrosomonas eutropha]